MRSRCDSLPRQGAKKYGYTLIPSACGDKEIEGHGTLKDASEKLESGPFWGRNR